MKSISFLLKRKQIEALQPVIAAMRDNPGAHTLAQVIFSKDGKACLHVGCVTYTAAVIVDGLTSDDNFVFDLASYVR